MFVLEVTSGPSQGQTIALTFGKRLTIGRAASCNLGFDDQELSSLHAEVSWTDDGFVIEDLDSLNGTYVNGKRIEGRAGLRLGDFIQVGQLLLRLKEAIRPTEPPPLPSSPKVPSAPPEETGIFSAKTMVVRRSSLVADLRAPKPGVRQPSLRRPRAIPTALPGPMLAPGSKRTQMAQIPISTVVDEDSLEAAADLARVIRGPASRGARVIARFGERLDPFRELPVSIGRERSNGIVLDDDTISLKHARIEQRAGHFVISDLGSSNGTFVNGQRVVTQKLADGDVLNIGRYVVLVVLSSECLGLEVGAPAIASDAPIEAAGSAMPRLGKVATPSSEKKKRKKKKASELVWFATSDLDRGVYRARSAMIGLMLGLCATAWWLSSGDSATLAGGDLMTAHESASFEAQANAMGTSRCTGCHVGVGRVSTLKCLDCHPHNRPRSAHASVNLNCDACHSDHRGSQFSSSAMAALGCAGCHPEPHNKLIRLRPKLVANFRLDAPAGPDFHEFHHIQRKVSCLTCHGEDVASGPRGARAACGQCHAPDHVVASECHLCHSEHPDRKRHEVVIAKATTVRPPRFRFSAVGWTLGLIAVPFVLAAFIPRQRKVVVDADAEMDG